MPSTASSSSASKPRRSLSSSSSASFKHRSNSRTGQSRLIESLQANNTVDLLQIPTNAKKTHRSRKTVASDNQLVNEPMDVIKSIDFIDLCSPVVEVKVEEIIATSVVPDVTTMPKSIIYEPRTLTSGSKRHMILPAYPAAESNDRPDLLLANVPCKLDYTFSVIDTYI